MKTTGSARERQRGVALMVALLALLLLSAIGLGMMYSSDTDTAINANYRDKQLAMYASMAGVQEARDRIQPQNTVANIPFPPGLPTLGSNTNVIYIINPKNGESVTPWDNNPSNPGSKYFDDELCQENVIGLTGTAGVPCPGPYPGYSAWATVYDDSQTSAAPWNLPTPLSAKWTRITLKANNMTPVAVNGSSSTSSQICWDGHEEILLPAGYGPNCGPLTSSVATITLQNAGTGWTSAPTVNLTGGGGSGAAAVAVGTSIPNGQVGSVTVTSGGSSYSSAPTVTFSGGGGSGAAATAVIVPSNGAPVASLNLLTQGNECYSSGSPPSVIISGGGGTGATGTATVSSTPYCIYSLQISATCKKNQTVNIGIAGGGGSGATVGTVSSPNGSGSTVTFTATPVINNPGTGYNGSALTVTADTGSGSNNQCSNVTAIASFGNLPSALTVTNGGGGYVAPGPTVTLGGGVGTGVGITAPTANATLGTVAANAGQVIAVNVTAGGSGYTSPPTVSFSGGGGSGATATATLGSTFTLTGVNVTAGGSGYTSPPAVSFSGGGGSGATAYASLAEGLYYGQVFLLTSMGQTPSGARAMTQSEVTTPVRGISLTGALTVDGPNPTMGALPNSSNFFINGNDGNSCGQTADPAHPAVGAYDDPNANPPTNSVGDITAAIPSGRTSNYMGSGPSPDVENVFGSLGDSMSNPTDMLSFSNEIQSLATSAGTAYGNNPGSIALGSAGSPVIDYVGGSLTLSGTNTGYGILLVTGTLNFGGNFSWNGLVFVIGDGVLTFNGGGSGQINGSVIVANIWDSSHNLLSSMGSPNISWVGGGGNGIQYDHCWADNMLAKIPWVPPASNKQLLILSTRTVSY